MSLTGLATRFESITSVISIAGRTLLGLDTNPVPGEWTHITKVDPEGEKKLPLLYPNYLSHSSAVSVGGSRDVTEQNTEETFELLAESGTTAFHEPSDSTHVTEQTREKAEFLAIPEVLNGDSESLVGTLGRGIEYLRKELGPSLLDEKVGMPVSEVLGDRAGDFVAAWMMEEAVFEAYIIMNPDSAAAREANVGEDDLLTPQEAKERALAAQHHLESEIIYLEYSGTFGGSEALEILDAIDDGVTWSQIWYGGGLDSRENVNSVLNAGADAVVVGDVFHRIAEVEVELFEQARTQFDSSTETESIREWVTETIDVAETDAARYLSTIPAVTRPTERATTYLTNSLEFGLAVDALASELSDPSAADIEQAVRDERLPAATQFGNIPGVDGKRLANRLARGLLADYFDVSSAEQVTARHLAIEL